MKNTKKIIAIIMMATVICSIFVACSRGNERENTVNNTVQESVENNTQDKEDIAVGNTEDKDNSTEKVTDDATESASKSNEQKNEDQTVTNQQKETDKTTTKKVTTTAKKQETTTKKKVETTTKKKVTTTKKAVTTTKKKVTTTKAAQKNVTPQEVQKQVNAYIKSKGATLDAVNAYGIHMTPDSASWSGRISRTQERLNSGKTLQTCKGYVDAEIAHGAKYLYCYYDSNWFYVLWLD